MLDGDVKDQCMQRLGAGEAVRLQVVGDKAQSGVLRIEMRVSLSRALHLPFAGSALRGAFGHALKALTDYLGQPQIYAQIFESTGVMETDSSGSAETGAASPAYVISPPLPLAQSRQTLCFGMTLLGAAVCHVELVREAWRMVFMRGLGTQRVTGVLEHYTQTDSTHLLAQMQSCQDCVQWQLLLVSPVFIKNRKLQASAQPLTAAQMQWEYWLHALHRRMRLAHSQYGAAIAEPAPFANWMHALSGLQVRAEWQDVGYTRHSQRQQKHIPLSGVVGVVHLQGRIPPALLEPLLLGQWLHAGSKTALGMGGYVLQAFAADQGADAFCPGVSPSPALSTLMH